MSDTSVFQSVLTDSIQMSEGKGDCTICGSEALIQLFKVVSCDACKSFFERTLRSYLQYSCPEIGECQLSTDSNKRCKACWYQRCAAAGMRPLVVQVLSPQKSKSKQITSNPINSRLPNSTVDLTTLSPSKVVDLLLSTEETFYPKKMPWKLKEIDTITCDPLLQILHSVENQFSVLCRWSTHVPNIYIHGISDEIRMDLLSSSWMEILLFNAAFNSVVVDKGLVFADGRYLNPNEVRQNSLCQLFNRFHENVVKPLRKLQLHLIERVVLRTIVLYDAEASNLVNNHHVNRVRSYLYYLLFDRVMSLGKDSSRLNELFAWLQHLRATGQMCYAYLKAVRPSNEDRTYRRLIQLAEQGLGSEMDCATISSDTNDYAVHR